MKLTCGVAQAQQAIGQGRHRAVRRRIRWRVVRRLALVIMAGASVVLTLVAPARAHASGTEHQASARQIMAACERGASMGMDGQTYVCIQRAPGGDCRHVFGTDACWWYTGKRAQVLFDARGDVAALG